MSELKRPDIVNVEEYFNEFVEYTDGQIISKLGENLTDRLNADYLFRDAGVIAELKCFQKDLFNNVEDVPKLVDFLYDWEKRKLISQGDKLKLIWGTKELPPECYQDLVNSCRKTVDRAIHKANKQILESKRTLSMPHAKGLLLLANDGNYLIQNEGFLAIITNLLKNKYLKSGIDGFVYFTVNQVSRLEGSNLDWSLWVPGYSTYDNKTFGDFVNNLGGKFQNEFYIKKTGINHSDKIITDNLEKGLATISKMKYIPKDIIYKK